MKKKPKAREISSIKAEALTGDLGRNYKDHLTGVTVPCLWGHGTKLSV